MQIQIDPDAVDEVLSDSTKEYQQLLAILETCDQHLSNLRNSVASAAPGLAQRLAYIAQTEQASRAKGFASAYAAQESLRECVVDFMEYEAQVAESLEEPAV